MLTVDISLPDVEELHKLVETGKEKGFLTYDEIVTGVEEVELTKEQLEDFTTYLIDHGVELAGFAEHALDVGLVSQVRLHQRRGAGRSCPLPPAVIVADDVRALGGEEPHA